MRAWDTSAAVKLYVSEPDSVFFRQLTEDEGAISMFYIARLEAATVFRRREAEGVLAEGEAQQRSVKLDLDIASGRIEVFPFETTIEATFTRVLEECFSANPPLFVRTNDALHVASALDRGTLEFVSTDLRQRAVAVLMGLTVLP